MRRLRLLSLTSVVLVSSSLVLGCDSKPAPAATTGQAAAEPAKPGADSGSVAPTTAGDPAAEGDTKPAAKPDKKTPPKPKLTEAARLHKELMKLLNEGRALTKKGDYAGGMAKYRLALEIDASDVAVLGELGWAAFKAGELDDAYRTTTQALKFVREDKRRGMLLYNLGRIDEERDNTADAIEHYQASLVARPNDTVKARLAALEDVQNRMAIAGSAGGELEGPDADANAMTLEALGRDLSDLAAVCKLVETERCEDYTMDEGDPCTCTPKVQATPGADASWGLVVLGEPDQTWQVAWFPVVKTDKGWTVFYEVLFTYNPGAFGIFEEAKWLPSTVEPLLGAGTQLVLKFTKSRMDRDMGLNEIEFEDYAGTVICARHETGAYCTDSLMSASSYVREVDFEGQDEEITGEAIEHDLTPMTGFESSFEFRDGKLIVTRTKTMNGFDSDGEVVGAIGPALAAGEYPLASLLGLPD